MHINSKYLKTLNKKAAYLNDVSGFDILFKA